MKSNIHLVAAVRPNFVKIAPLYQALQNETWCNTSIIHTGQHYDWNMSEVFFNDLGLSEPHVRLGVGSGSHAEQTAGVMVAYEKLCLKERPDWVVVVGDVNPTMACALAAKKLCISVAHLEAGLRSGDRSMPEELNRIVTDAIADRLWVPSADAEANLRTEGIPSARIVHVGNIMMDSYELLRAQIEAQPLPITPGLQPRQYGVVTLHRPSNVDSAEGLASLLHSIIEVAKKIPLVFPLHPRTRQRIHEFGLMDDIRHCSGLRLMKPLGYVQFMGLVRQATFVVTDSGGVQEETTYLGIPCITLRTTTERPITVSQGSNRLAHPDELSNLVQHIMVGEWHIGAPPDSWDGKTAQRIVNDLRMICSG